MSCGSAGRRGGDDYDLLFTVAPGYAGRVAALASNLDLPLTPIGRITAGGGLRVMGRMGGRWRWAGRGESMGIKAVIPLGEPTNVLWRPLSMVIEMTIFFDADEDMQRAQFIPILKDLGMTFRDGDGDGRRWIRVKGETREIEAIEVIFQAMQQFKLMG